MLQNVWAVSYVVFSSKNGMVIIIQMVYKNVLKETIIYDGMVGRKHCIHTLYDNNDNDNDNDDDNNNDMQVLIKRI